MLLIATRCFAILLHDIAIIAITLYLPAHCLLFSALPLPRRYAFTPLLNTLRDMLRMIITPCFSC